MSIRPILLVVSAVCPLVVLAVSCGGSDTDLFGNTEASSSAAQGTGTASGSTGTGGFTSSGASSSVSAGGAAGAGGSGGSGGVGGGGGQNTGGSMSSAGGAGGGSPTSSSMSSGSGGGGPTVPEVYCNGQPCAPGEVCCWAQFMGQDFCSAPGGCGMGYAQLSCNDIEDCALGERCCGTFNQFNQTYTSVQCQPMCNMGQIIMCSGHPRVCPMGQMCIQSAYLGMGYMVCQ